MLNHFNESCDVILALLASLAEQSDISFEQKKKSSIR